MRRLFDFDTDADMCLTTRLDMTEMDDEMATLLATVLASTTTLKRVLYVVLAWHVFILIFAWLDT